MQHRMIDANMFIHLNQPVRFIEDAATSIFFL